MPPSPSPALLWHTLRPLRPRQWQNRLWRRAALLWSRPERLAARLGPARSAPPARLPGPPAPPPLAGDNRREALLDGRFVFLRREAELGWLPDWRAEGLPRLWQYLLHYHDWLWLLDEAEARAAALDWIERHPPRADHCGWEPYPVSLRLMNWTSLFFGRWRETTAADPAFAARLWTSLRLQAEWLRRRLEFHLMGNHLLENAAALAFVGAAFEGPEAARWKRRGLALLGRELPEQFLADGLHFERAPMYHLRATQALLWLAATGDPALWALVEPRLGPALSAARLLSHPDGGPALLNDSALGVYPDPAALEAAAAPYPSLAVPPPAGPFALPVAGYYGARTAGGDYLVCDAAPVGPDYIPGHAHGDLLGFELSVGGRRCLVDGGLYDYERGPLRDWSRSTRAHNTVEIEDADQCEFWAAFRVGRRARPRGVRFEPHGEGFLLEAWHDGYLRLEQRARHARRFEYAPGRLTLDDRIRAEDPVRATARFHLHPSFRISTMGPRRAVVEGAGIRLEITIEGEGRLEAQPGRYCPRFGEALETQTLAWLVQGRDPAWKTTLAWEA